MENKTGLEILSEIQSELKAPKNQYNSFGKYHYRSCEDILEAIKPLCKKHNAIVTLSDKIIEVAGQLFVEACATFEVGNYSKTVTAQAMHSLEKKGMDASQITGSTSSYARKYALNGLFCIDDTRDADSTNTHGKESKQSQKDPLEDWRNAINALNTEADLTAFYKQNKSNMNQDILNLLSERKAYLITNKTK